jgi:hypothetical protein
LRRPHREIEIFSMSVLDMFASALGAFIMVTIILYPYYKQDIKAQLSASLDALEERRRELQSVNESVDQERQRNARQARMVEELHEQQAQVRRCRQELAVCLSELSDTFLMVMIQWNEDANVDLHVTDPQGNEFFWRKSNLTGRDYPASQAQLSFDVTGGPGIEVWLSPLAGPGDYKIEYALSRRYGRAVTVSGYYLERTGRRQLPSKILKDDELRVRAATLRLAADGKITVQP